MDFLEIVVKIEFNVKDAVYWDIKHWCVGDMHV